VAVAGIALEYARRSKNDTEKEARQLERVATLEKQISELEIVATNQSAHLIQLERLIQHHISPPTSPSNASKTSSTSISTPTTTSSSTIISKTPAGQSFAIVDTCSMQSPLMQLHPIDVLLLPMVFKMEATQKFLLSSVKQWLSLGSSKK
jgi:hypothetical protein